MYTDFHVYLDLNWEDYINQQQTYLSNLNKIIRLAYMHQSNVYYSREQLTEFVHHCGDLIVNFTASVGNQLHVVLQNALPLNDEGYELFTVHFANEGSHIVPEKSQTFKLIKHSQKASLISLTQQSGLRSFLKIRSTDDFYPVRVNVVNNENEIIRWYNLTGNRRIFHYSPKHGENGVGHWNGASPLLSSREHAQTMLELAIADFSVKNRFFTFDDAFETYIEYFYEGDNTKKQWHAFHLSNNQWNRVPNSIRKHFNH